MQITVLFKKPIEYRETYFEDSRYLRKKERWKISTVFFFLIEEKRIREPQALCNVAPRCIKV